MEAVMKFLSDLLTDRVDSVKETALELYTNLKLEAVKIEPVVMPLSIPIPNCNKLLNISKETFLESRELWDSGMRIDAIKSIRQHSSVDGETPGLKETKEFAEVYCPSHLFGSVSQG